MILKILKWMLTGNTGISSECIASVMAGITPKRKDIPYDPSDFERCLGLVNTVPGIRERLPEMREVSTKWNQFMDSWDAIEKSFMEEVPEWLDGNYTHRATKTFALMQKSKENL